MRCCKSCRQWRRGKERGFGWGSEEAVTLAAALLLYENVTTHFLQQTLVSGVIPWEGKPFYEHSASANLSIVQDKICLGMGQSDRQGALMLVLKYPLICVAHLPLISILHVSKA